MQKTIAVLLAAALPAVTALADTKRIECGLSGEGVQRVLLATIDDDSLKAEVKFYRTTDKCANDNTCGTEIYQKDVMPTVIRFSRTQSFAPADFTIVTTIDIDRSTLAVITKQATKSSAKSAESIYTGSCKLSVDTVKKLL